MRDWTNALGSGMQEVHARVRDGVDALSRGLLEAADAVRRLDPDAAAHADLVATFVVDDGQRTARAHRVASRLDRVRVTDGKAPLAAPFVLWIPLPTAFATPGGRTYLSRALVDLLPDDAALAFVIGHEMAHHDLGHLSPPPSLARWLVEVPVAARLALVGRQALHAWMRPEWELAADRAGLDLALRAGYPAGGAELALRALERYALDHRSLGEVFGWSEEGDRDDARAGVAEWLRQRARGYVPLRERIEALRGEP
jgi:predicted Zn-dependent protease